MQSSGANELQEKPGDTHHDSESLSVLIDSPDSYDVVYHVKGVLLPL